MFSSMLIMAKFWHKGNTWSILLGCSFIFLDKWTIVNSKWRIQINIHRLLICQLYGVVSIIQWRWQGTWWLMSEGIVPPKIFREVDYLLEVIIARYQWVVHMPQKRLPGSKILTTFLAEAMCHCLSSCANPANPWDSTRFKCCLRFWPWTILLKRWEMPLLTRQIDIFGPSRWLLTAIKKWRHCILRVRLSVVNMNAAFKMPLLKSNRWCGDIKWLALDSQWQSSE